MRLIIIPDQANGPTVSQTVGILLGNMYMNGWKDLSLYAEQFLKETGEDITDKVSDLWETLDEIYNSMGDSVDLQVFSVAIINKAIDQFNELAQSQN